MKLIIDIHKVKLIYKSNRYLRQYLLGIMLAICMAGCRTHTLEHVDVTKLPDGEYVGKSFKFPGRMIVHTIVKDGKICEIKIVKHFALKKYTNMMQPLIADIIAKQDVNVDAVTGATISSRALKLAVHDSLKNASKQASTMSSRSEVGNK